MPDFSKTVQLIDEAQAGDIQAAEEIIRENSPLIKSVIRRYKNKGVEYDDLFQIGSLGFLKAIRHFDKSFNVKFSTYAVPMIAGEVKRYLRDNGYIKVSRSVKAQAVLINRFTEKFLNEQGRQPTVTEIGEEFNLSPAEVVFAMESNYQPISLYSQVGDDEGNKKQYLIDKIPDDKPMDKDLDNFLLLSIIKGLDPRDRKIIILRYFRDKTQKEIATILGVSQVQVSRLENKILQQIKNKMAVE